MATAGNKTIHKPSLPCGLWGGQVQQQGPPHSCCCCHWTSPGLAAITTIRFITHCFSASSQTNSQSQEKEISMPSCPFSLREVTELVSKPLEQRRKLGSNALRFLNICKNKNNFQCENKVVSFFGIFILTKLTFTRIFWVSDGDKTH